MLTNKKKVAVILGQTGTGKTTLLNILCNRNVYEEGDGADSHTHFPQSSSIKEGDTEIIFIDNPGLSDSEGSKADEKNIINIVNNIKNNHKFINSVLIVFNYQAPRCDSSIQEGVRLLVDSFGTSIFKIVSFVFLKNKTVFEEIRNQETRKKGDEFLKKFKIICGVSVESVPMYSMDAHPEEGIKEGTSDEVINKRKEILKKERGRILRWIQTCKEFDIGDAKPATPKIIKYQNEISSIKKENSSIKEENNSIKKENVFIKNNLDEKQNEINNLTKKLTENQIRSTEIGKPYIYFPPQPQQPPQPPQPQQPQQPQQPPQQQGFHEGMPVDLIGKYHGDSYGGNGIHDRAIGWPGLYIGRIFRDGRAAPYEICRNNVGIAWAPESSIRRK